MNFQKKWLRQIFRAFEMMNRCYDGEEGAVSGGEDSGGEPTEDLNLPEPSEKSSEPSSEPEGYFGNVEVNPEQRPLRPEFDTAGYSQDEINQMLGEVGSDAFMTDEEIAAANGEKSVDPKGGDPKNVVDDNADPKEDDGGEFTTEELKGFYDSHGLTEAQFTALPEKAKESLLRTSFAQEQASNSPQFKELNEQYTQLKKTTETLESDPVIAARVAEINSGKKYVATDIPGISDQDVAAIDAAFDDDTDGHAKVKEIINRVIRDNAKAAVSVERSVADKAAQIKRDDADVISTLEKIASIDKKRLDLKGTPISEILAKGASHPKYADYKLGIGGVLEFLQTTGHTPDQVRKLGPEAIYNLYSHSKGWHVEQIKEIQNDRIKKYMEKIRNPKTATLLKATVRRSRPDNGSLSPAGIDRNSLKAEMLSGKTSEFGRLFDMAGESGNDALMDVLTDLRDEVERESENKNN